MVASLELSEGVWPLQHLDFRLSNPRTTREYVSTVLVVIGYGIPKKLIKE